MVTYWPPGLQWQAWINGDLVGLALIACQEGFFLQVQVWCGPTLMQNMVVAAPLLSGTLHFDMDAIADTSLVRVAIYIPGGNTLTSSRVLLSGYPCPSGGDMACSGSPRKQRNNDLDLSRCCTAIRCSGGPSVAPPPLLWGRGYLLPSQTS